MINEKLPAIILAAGSNGLGAIRSLSLEGIKIIAIVLSAEDVCLKSRLVSETHILDTENFESNLLEILGKLSGSGGVVIPTTDRFVSFINHHSEELGGFGFKFNLLGTEIADGLLDKALETKLIEPIIPIPRSCQKLPAIADELLEQIRLPIIFKPRSFEHYRINGKNKQVRSREELDQFYTHYEDVLNSVIAQEIVEGGDENLWVCNCTFNRDSDLVGVFVFRRLRLSPPHYGVTSYAMSETNKEVVKLTRKLGKELKYVGAAMVEFKYDARDSVYKYIELNPRIGMCNFFDTSCGVNNVYLSYLVALGKEIPSQVQGQRDRVIYVDLFDDLYTRIRIDKEPIFQVFKHYFSDVGKKHVFAYFTWYDPLPALIIFPKFLGAFYKYLHSFLSIKNK